MILTLVCSGFLRLRWEFSLGILKESKVGLLGAIGGHMACNMIAINPLLRSRQHPIKGSRILNMIANIMYWPSRNVLRDFLWESKFQ